MSDFKIVASVNEIQLSPEWKDIRPYGWKNLCLEDLVDAKGKKISRHYFGREYQLVAIKERQYSKAERLLRGFLGVIAVVAFLGLTLFFKPVRDLFLRKSETLYFGVAFESNLNPHETNLYNKARRLLIANPQIKHPMLNIPRNIKIGKVWQQLAREKLVPSCGIIYQGNDLVMTESRYPANKSDKSEISKRLKALTPDFLKKHQKEILKAVSIIEKPDFKNYFRWDRKDECIIFIQNRAIMNLVMHLTVEQMHQILEDYKRLNPEDHEAERLKLGIESCKQFLMNDDNESSMEYWLGGRQVIDDEAGIEFRKIVQLRDLLFLNQPRHWYEYY